LLAAAGNMAGGLLMTRIYNTGKRFLKHLVALGAGFMIAVVFSN